MHFDDLTTYTYPRGVQVERLRNVGWLDEGHPFRRGTCNPEIVPVLEAHYDKLKAAQMRGHHACSLCEGPSSPTVLVRGRPLPLGAAELWVPYGELVFAAPDLIIHYLRDHSYCPPEEFQQAVLAFPDRIEAWDSEEIEKEVEIVQYGRATPRR